MIFFGLPKVKIVRHIHALKHFHISENTTKLYILHKIYTDTNSILYQSIIYLKFHFNFKWYQLQLSL